MSFENAAQAKAQLDRLMVDAEFFPERSPLLEEARANFLAAGVALVQQATPWLWAYYRSVYEMYGAEDREEYGIPDIADEASVWHHVSFGLPPTISAPEGAPYEPDPSYISFEGSVAWEEEHGLQLVFSHGLAVCKVGPYDGHHTVARALADPSLIGVILGD